MGVARNDDAGPQLQCGLNVDIVEVESLRLRIHLEQDATLRRFPGNRVEVERHRRTPAEQALRGVSKNVHRGMAQGAQHPSRLRGAGECQAGVDRGHDDIERAERVIIEVQTAVREDVHFGPGKDGKSVQRSIEAIDGDALAAKSGPIEAAGDSHEWGVVGDREIAVPQFARGTHHGREGVSTVTARSVAVQVTPDVIAGEETRQLAGSGSLQFSAVLAQFRGDQRQADGACDLPFGAPRDAPLAVPDTILVHLESARLGPFADRDVVGVGAGEIVQTGPIALLRQYAKIDLEP